MAAKTKSFKHENEKFACRSQNTPTSDVSNLIAFFRSLESLACITDDCKILTGNGKLLIVGGILFLVKYGQRISLASVLNSYSIKKYC